MFILLSSSKAASFQFDFVLFVAFARQRDKASLLHRDIRNFSLALDEQDQRKQMRRLRFHDHSTHCKDNSGGGGDVGGLHGVSDGLFGSF